MIQADTSLRAIFPLPEVDSQPSWAVVGANSTLKQVAYVKVNSTGFTFPFSDKKGKGNLEKLPEPILKDFIEISSYPDESQFITYDSMGFYLVDSLGNGKRIEALPSKEGITSIAVGDSGWIAIGDKQGRVSVFDLDLGASGLRRKNPPLPLRPV